MDIPVPETWAEARTLLLPVLRRTTEPSSAWSAGQSDPYQQLVRRDFAPNLSAMVVLDLPDMRVYINREHLGSWGVEADEAFQVAHANLTPDAARGLRMREDFGLLHLDAEDGYESSRLLLPGWLEAFRDNVAGAPLAAVPGRRLLLVGGTESETQVQTLLDIAWQAFRTGGGPLSPVLYTTDGAGRVVPWVPSLDSPFATRARAGQCLLAAYEYSEQRERLLAEGVSEAVPAVTLVRTRTTGESYTVCRWEEQDGEALLPETDRVVMVSADTETEVSWETLVQHAAGCLEPTDHRPGRHRARWPMPRTYRAITGSS